MGRRMGSPADRSAACQQPPRARCEGHLSGGPSCSPPSCVLPVQRGRSTSHGLKVNPNLATRGQVSTTQVFVRRPGPAPDLPLVF